MATKISIHDYENGRVILADVPAWIEEECERYNIALEDVILPALGLSASSSEWMVYNNVYIGDLADLVDDFEGNAREAIQDNL